PFCFPTCGAFAFSEVFPPFRSLPSITGCFTFGPLLAHSSSYLAGKILSICSSFGATFMTATSCPPLRCSTSTPSFAFSGRFPLTSLGSFGMNPTPLPIRTRRNEPLLDLGPTTHFLCGGHLCPSVQPCGGWRRVAATHRPAKHVAHGDPHHSGYVVLVLPQVSFTTSPCGFC